jgi:uncharacterized protein DUF6153
MLTLGAMSLRTQPRSPVRHALWLTGLLVVLSGLFGMHGLDNHGGEHGGAVMESVTRSAVTVPAHSAASGHEAMTGAARAATTVASASAAALGGAVTDATGHTGMDMGAAGMCMAVLVLSLLLLILSLYASRVPPLLWLVARAVRSPVVRGRDPDPPSLFRLSIQRC